MDKEEKIRIYLDNNAATYIDPRIFDAYVHSLKNCWANPSSAHREGQRAKGLLAEARAKIAKVFDVPSQHIVFFSSATEALNTLIRGLLIPRPHSHVITSVTEHAAVWQCCKRFEKEGHSVSFLPTHSYGALAPQALQEAVRTNTTGICLMSVNNETGVLTDIQACASIAENHNIPFVVDGVAGLGKEPFTLFPGVSAACFSSYKIHGPCGVGFAVLNHGVSFQPLLEGGGQELGRRSGSENVCAIYACALAVELAFSEMKTAAAKMVYLRDRFEKTLSDKLSGIQINGDGPRVCNTSNIAFDGVNGEELLIQLDLAGVSASHGAACAAGALEPSRILLEMGFSRERAASSVRFSLSKFTTVSEIDQAVNDIVQAVQRQRTLRA
jgi:cysteine desulfurase